jgi:hypothetical protein
MAEIMQFGSFCLLAEYSPYRGNPWLLHALEGGSTLLALAYSVFWFWMLWHCMRTEPDRQYWLWLMIFVPGIGAVVFFL